MLRVQFYSMTTDSGKTCWCHYWSFYITQNLLLSLVFLYTRISKCKIFVNFGKSIPVHLLNWHCTEINSHVGLEMLNIFFSVCTEVTHLLLNMYGLVYAGVITETNKVFFNEKNYHHQEKNVFEVNKGQNIVTTNYLSKRIKIL